MYKHSRMYFSLPIGYSVMPASDLEQASTTDTVSTSSSVEMSTSDSCDAACNAVGDNSHSDSADSDADLLTYTPVHPSTHCAEESESDNNDDRNGDGDDSCEDIHVRHRGLRNIPWVQYSATVLCKFIKTCDEPTLSMALKSSEWIHLVNAIRRKFNTLADLGTWEDPAEHSRNASVISSEFVFRLKRNEVGSPGRFIARLVARGNLQEEEFEHGALYAPVACIETVCILMTVSAFIEWETAYLDIKGAVINALLPEPDRVYMDLLSASGLPAASGQRVRLVKSFFGLKKAPKLRHGTKSLGKPLKILVFVGN